MLKNVLSVAATSVVAVSTLAAVPAAAVPAATVPAATVPAATVQEEPTITDLVAASGATFDDEDRDYDILGVALDVAGLTGILDDRGAEFTVLAPTDRAFLETARELGYLGRTEQGAWLFLVDLLTEIGDGDPIPTLRVVLTYHVLAGDFDYRAVRTGGTRTTVANIDLTPMPDRAIQDQDPDNADPKLNIFASNIDAANGTIHTINRVLLPVDLAQPSGTVVDRIAGTAGHFDTNLFDYDLLATALETAGLTSVFDDPSVELTVLAPYDLAFVLTARDLGYQGFDEAGAWEFLVGALTELGDGDPIPVLTEILTYHVIAGERDFREIRTGGAITALNGGTIDAQLDRSLGDASPGIRDARLLFGRSNLDASNGIVHTVNRVLLPVDLG